MKRPYHFKAQCLICDYVGTVLHNSKEDYQEVSVCPKCKGAFVDTWKLPKYQDNQDVVTVSINSITDAPIVKVNDEKVSLVEYEHHYVTKDEYSNGVHNYQIKYFDESTKTIKVIGHEKIG